jgi:hypothetical protein
MWDIFQKVGIGWSMATILTASGFVFTIGTFIGAVRRWLLLRRHHLNGNRQRYALRVVRHESFRVFGHAMVVYAMILSMQFFLWPGYEVLPHDGRVLMLKRTIVILLISAKMTLNSALDMYDRKRGLQGYLRSAPLLSPSKELV